MADRVEYNNGTINMPSLGNLQVRETDDDVTITTNKSYLQTIFIISPILISIIIIGISKMSVLPKIVVVLLLLLSILLYFVFKNNINLFGMFKNATNSLTNN